MRQRRLRRLAALSVCIALWMLPAHVSAAESPLALYPDSGVEFEVADEDDVHSHTLHISTAAAGDYPPGEVPRIYVETAKKNGLSLTKAKGAAAATLTVVEPDGTVTQDTAGEISVRGNSTSALLKKPYNIKFSSKVDLCGFGKAKKYSLLANCMDPTLLLQYLAMDFAREMGLPYTSEQCCAELWLDGSYRGCYLLTEPVQVKKNRVDIGDDVNSFLIQYEANAKTRNEPDAVYIRTNGQLRYEVKYPEEPTAAQLSAIKAVLNTCETAVSTKNWAKASALMDTESLVRLYLVNEFTKNADADFSSVFFYYHDGVIYAGPAWDYDLSLGNVSKKVYASYYTDGVNYKTLRAKSAGWVKNWFNMPEFQQLVKRTFRQYYGVMAEMTETAEAVRDDHRALFDRNFSDAGWSVSKQYSSMMYPPLATYDKNFDDLTSFIVNRTAYLKGTYMKSAVPGDVNEDGAVTAADVILLHGIIFDRVHADEVTGWRNADLDGNGILNAADLTLLKRIYIS